MAKPSKSGVSASKLENTHASREKSLEPAKFSEIGGIPKEHRALYPKEWHGVNLLVDDHELTLDQLLDALWNAQSERDLLAREIDAATEATVRIYGQPPFDGCSLSEYLEIVADGQLDEVRAEFEELEDESE